MASEQQTDTPTPAAPVGYESDGGDTQRSADETQYESDGCESLSMLVLHPPPRPAQLAVIALREYE